MTLQGGRWISYHIDDLHPESEKNCLPLLSSLEGKSIAALYKEALQVVNVPSSDMQNNMNVPLENSIHTATASSEDFMLKKQLTDGDKLQTDHLITCLDVDNLVYRCIHKAAAMVKDYEADIERKTGRVPILLQLLSRKRGESTLPYFLI